MPTQIYEAPINSLKGVKERLQTSLSANESAIQDLVLGVEETFVDVEKNEALLNKSINKAKKLHDRKIAALDLKKAQWEGEIKHRKSLSISIESEIAEVENHIVKLMESQRDG